MPWSSGFESQQSNLTSLLGTLSEMREGKKNRRARLLSDLLGIGANLGGVLLQNKWSKQAADLANQRATEAATTEWERQRQAELEGRGYETRKATAEAMARTREMAARLRGEKEQEQMRINAGAYSRGGGREQEDASKLIPYDIASQAWDGWWERLQAANPKRQMSAKDFDDFRGIAVQAGAKYGFSQQQMEEAVNTLAQSYGFDIAPNVPGATPAVVPPPVTPRVRPQGLGEHAKATVSGLKAVGQFFAREGKKAIAGVKESFGGGINEQSVLNALAQAKQLIGPREMPEVEGYEAEVMQAGVLAPARLKAIMDRLSKLVRPK